MADSNPYGEGLSPTTAGRMRKQAKSKVRSMNTAVLSDDDNSLLGILSDDILPKRRKDDTPEGAPESDQMLVPLSPQHKETEAEVTGDETKVSGDETEAPSDSKAHPQQEDISHGAVIAEATTGDQNKGPGNETDTTFGERANGKGRTKESKIMTTVEENETESSGEEESSEEDTSSGEYETSSEEEETDEDESSGEYETSSEEEETDEEGEAEPENTEAEEQPKGSIPSKDESIKIAAEANSVPAKKEEEAEEEKAEEEEETKAAIVSNAERIEIAPEVDSIPAEKEENAKEDEAKTEIPVETNSIPVEKEEESPEEEAGTTQIPAEDNRVPTEKEEHPEEETDNENEVETDKAEEEQQPKAAIPSNLESVEIAAEANTSPAAEEESSEEEEGDEEEEESSEDEADGEEADEEGEAEEAEEMTEAVIPSNVESIEIAAEANSIPAEAFESCQQLKSVSFPADSQVQSIGEASFYKCEALTEIHFPQHLEWIAKEAFLGCVELRTVRFMSPETLQRIEKYAFYGCKSLLELGLPVEFDRIDRNAFYGCFKLHPYPKSADPKIFVYTGEDDGQFDVPEDVTHVRVSNFCESIPKKTFMYRHQLLQADFRKADNLKTIEKHAFYRCDNLRDVNLSATPLQSIGQKAFFGCKSLTSIHPPKTLTLVDGDALNYSGFYVYNGNAGEMVPADMKQVRVGTSVDSLPKEAFVQCEKLQEVVLTEALRLTSIGEEAFYYSDALAEISLPRGVRIIERAAFLGCSSLSKVSLNTNLEVIGDEAFEACTSLRTIAMSENVQVIGDSAFYACSKLKQVRLNDLLRVIGQEAFMSCKSLVNITLPSGLNTLGESAFEQCLKLQCIDLSGPDNLPLAMHIRVQYEDEVGEKLKMASLVQMYAETPLDASRLMSDNEEELQLLDEIKSAYLLVELDGIAKFPHPAKDNGFVQFLSHHLDNQSAESLYDYLQGADTETVYRLANAKDFSGNSAFKVAKPPVLQAFQERLSFLGRYNLQEEPTVCKSDNAIVVEALDYEMEEFYAEGFDRWSLAETLDDELLCRALEDLMLIPLENSFVVCNEYFRQVDHKNEGEITKEQFLSFCTEKFGRKVVLKFMRHEDQYQRELERYDMDLDRRHVLRILRHHDKRDTPGMADALPDFIGAHIGNDESPSDYCHLIVLPHGDRNLEAIYRFEKPDGLEVKSLLQEVGKALSHLHANGLVHGNLRMSKIIRQNGHVKLTDMAASAQTGSEPLGLKVSSGVLPPEMIYGVRGSKSCEQLEEYYQKENPKIQESRAPKISYMPSQPWCVARAYLTDKNRKGSSFVPRTEGLPYELLQASASVDVWAFGVLVYACCTGHTLFKTNYRDSIEERNSLRMLCDWSDDDLEASLAQGVEDDATKDLLRSLLQREESMRPSMQEVLRHPFFDPDAKMTDWQSLSTAPTPTPHHDYVTVLNDDLETPHMSNKRSVPAQQLKSALIASGPRVDEETVSVLEYKELSKEVEALKAELKKSMVTSSKGEDGSVSLAEYKKLSDEVVHLKDELKKSKHEIPASPGLNRHDPTQYPNELQDVEVVCKGWLQKRRFEKTSLWKNRYFVSYKDGTVTYFQNASDLNDPRNGGCSFHLVRFQKPDEGIQDTFELHTQQGEPIMQLRLSDLTIGTVDDWLGAKHHEDNSVVHKGWLQKQSRKHKQLWNDRYFVLDRTGTVMYYASAATANNPSAGGATFPRVKWEHVADTSKKEDFDLKTMNDELIMKLRLSKLSSSAIGDWMKGNHWFEKPSQAPEIPRGENNATERPSATGSAPHAVVYANELGTFSGISEMDVTYDGARIVDKETGKAIEDTWEVLNDRQSPDEIADATRPAEEENEIIQKKSDDAIVFEETEVAKADPNDSATADGDGDADQPIEEKDIDETPTDSITTPDIPRREDKENVSNDGDAIKVDLLQRIEESADKDDAPANGDDIAGETIDLMQLIEENEEKDDAPDNGDAITNETVDLVQPDDEGAAIDGEPNDVSAIQEKQGKGDSPVGGVTNGNGVAQPTKEESETKDAEAVQIPRDEQAIGDAKKNKDFTNGISKAFQLFKRKEVNSVNDPEKSGNAISTATDDKDPSYSYSDSVVSKNPKPNQIFAPVSAVNFAGEVGNPTRSDDGNSLSVKSNPTEQPNTARNQRRLSEEIPRLVSQFTDRLQFGGKERRRKRREKKKILKRLSMQSYESADGVVPRSSM